MSDEMLRIVSILETNGIEDAIIELCQKFPDQGRKFALLCADHALEYFELHGRDSSVFRYLIKTYRDHQIGVATDTQLNEAVTSAQRLAECIWQANGTECNTIKNCNIRYDTNHTGLVGGQVTSIPGYAAIVIMSAVRCVEPEAAASRAHRFLVKAAKEKEYNIHKDFFEQIYNEYNDLRHIVNLPNVLNSKQLTMFIHHMGSYDILLRDEEHAQGMWRDFVDMFQNISEEEE